MVEGTKSGKHSSLLRDVIDYDRKKFYSAVPQQSPPVDADLGPVL